MRSAAWLASTGSVPADTPAALEVADEGLHAGASVVLEREILGGDARSLVRSTCFALCQ